MPFIWIIHAKLIVFLNNLKKDLTFAYFNLHFIKTINTKYHCIWSTCTYENKTCSALWYIKSM